MYSQAVLNEWRMHARLNHPNIVKFMGWCGPKLPVCIMEICYISLQEHIWTHGKMSQEQCLDLAAQLSDGVGYLHNSWQLIHCDIKTGKPCFM